MTAHPPAPGSPSCRTKPAWSSTRPRCRPTAAASAGTSTNCCPRCSPRAPTWRSSSRPTTSPHYRQLLPGAELLAGAGRRSPGRAVRFAWEQAGPAAGWSRRSGADVLHSPHYTMPLRARRARGDDAARRHLLHPPRRAPAGQAAASSAPGRGSRCAGRAAASRRRRPPATSWSGSPARGADRVDVAHLGRGRRAGSTCPSEAERAAVRAHLGLDRPVRRLPRHPRAAQERRRPRRAAGCRPSPGTDDPPALVLAGGRGWDDEIDRAVAEVPAGLDPAAARLPAAGAAGRPARRRRGGGLPQPRRGLRPAGARGDGLRRAGADHPHRSSLPEVGGDAVAYTEPDAAIDRRRAARAARRPRPAAATLAAAARARAARFDWGPARGRTWRSYAAAAGPVTPGP